MYLQNKVNEIAKAIVKSKVVLASEKTTNTTGSKRINKHT